MIASINNHNLIKPEHGLNWGNPPDELLLNIFEYLDLPSCVQATRVNKKWHSLRSEPRLLGNKIAVRKVFLNVMRKCSKDDSYFYNFEVDSPSISFFKLKRDKIYVHYSNGCLVCWNLNEQKVESSLFIPERIRWMKIKDNRLLVCLRDNTIKMWIEGKEKATNVRLPVYKSVCMAGSSIFVVNEAAKGVLEVDPCLPFAQWLVNYNNNVNITRLAGCENYLGINYYKTNAYDVKYTDIVDVHKKAMIRTFQGVLHKILRIGNGCFGVCKRNEYSLMHLASGQEYHFEKGNKPIYNKQSQKFYQFLPLSRELIIYSFEMNKGLVPKRYKLSSSEDWIDFEKVEQFGRYLFFKKLRKWKTNYRQDGSSPGPGMFTQVKWVEEKYVSRGENSIWEIQKDSKIVRFLRISRNHIVETLTKSRPNMKNLGAEFIGLKNGRYLHTVRKDGENYGLYVTDFNFVDERPLQQDKEMCILQ